MLVEYWVALTAEADCALVGRVGGVAGTSLFSCVLTAARASHSDLLAVVVSPLLALSTSVDVYAWAMSLTVFILAFVPVSAFEEVSSMARLLAVRPLAFVPVSAF